MIINAQENFSECGHSNTEKRMGRPGNDTSLQAVPMRKLVDSCKRASFRLTLWEGETFNVETEKSNVKVRQNRKRQGPSGGRIVMLDIESAGELLTLQRAAFATEVFFTYPGYTDPITQTIDQLRAEFLQQDAVAVGFRQGTRLVGAARIRPMGPHAVFLYRLSVAPDKVGEGIALQVMKGALQTIREKFSNATRVEIGADGKVTWLIEWYERLGFDVFQRGTESSADEWKLVLDLPLSN